MNASSDDIYASIQAERERAHAKHGEKSMESAAPDDMKRLRILLEEVGEVAREFNDADIANRPVDLAALRGELIQTAAMAAAWAEACDVLTGLADLINRAADYCRTEMCSEPYPDDQRFRCYVPVDDHGPRHQAYTHYPAQVVTWPAADRRTDNDERSTT